ncbi:hypothetical protein LSTR_LSTR004222 [Laodelphax striatellus]|uniref:PHD-type domain-containing protein n=1 Tax=Laodelphax striatellus TaxID=195883 RepID=A0A482X9C7_LAOST|nr:hypothetical protein LSTR_LSTR004222 [Laodelphax striatellus]
MADYAIKLEKFCRNKCCVLCNGKDSDEVTFGSIYKLGKIEVHYFCLLLSSIVVQKGEDEEGILGFLPDDILQAAQALSRVECTYCGARGANVRCAAARCRVVFHYPCGIKNNSFHKFSGRFPSYCSKHRSQQRIPKKVLELIKSAQLECVVCLDSVELDTNMIWAPCCQKSALFHRRCLQRLAISFGSYALKCPLCNNKNKFCSALMENGIFIPEQDASWEAEPNAFSELLQRHNHCDAVKCVSPRGRHFSQNFVSSMWKIILCSDCGSQGIHRKCLRLSSGGRSHLRWRCDVCRSTERTPSDQLATAIDSYTISSDSNPESDVEVVAYDGIQCVSASTSTTTLRIPNGNHQLVSSTATVKDEPDQEADQAAQEDDQAEQGGDHTDQKDDEAQQEGDQPQQDDGDRADQTDDHNNASVDNQLPASASMQTRSVKRSRSGATEMCDENDDESIHEEKVFVCHAEDISTAILEPQTNGFIEASAVKEEPLGDMKDVQSFQLKPILIIDSDDEKDMTICIDSDESDDAVVEITNDDDPIEISVIHHADYARRSNRFPLIGRGGGAGNRVRYINVVCPHGNMICAQQVPGPPAN